LTADYITSSEALTLCNNSEAISAFIYIEKAVLQNIVLWREMCLIFLYNFCLRWARDTRTKLLTSSSKAAVILAPL